MEKPSAYLVGKCECLAKVVDFFLSNNGGYHRSVKDKRTVFLSQIDFWDWEMDELCYSVDSFTERSQAWESCATMRDSLGKLGIPVDPAIVHKIESDRGWNTYFIGKNQVVPPTDALNDVIKKWNKLLKVCEDTLLMERKERVNPAFTSIIGKYKYRWMHKITIHESAAYVIGRRGMGFNEKLSFYKADAKKVKELVLETLEGKYKNRKAHSWTMWKHLNDNIEAVLPALRVSLADLKEFVGNIWYRGETLRGEVFLQELLAGSKV